MRIIHLSDVHLDRENTSDLENFYMGELINDLKSFHSVKPINLVLITGDLLNKGGESFGKSNAYELFRDKFITPIVRELGLPTSNFLFVPGNHDVNKEFIEEENEVYLTQRLTSEMANQTLLPRMKDEWVNANRRVMNFKEFEKTFHANEAEYNYSNNESTFIYQEDGENVGFVLVNDSWRCSPDLKKENHFIGYRQLLNAARSFEQKSTRFNVALFHHPLQCFNPLEADEIENVLSSKNFRLAFFGHTHRNRTESVASTGNGVVRLVGRCAFNDVYEQNSRYQPGYTIVDVDINNLTCEVHGRKFVRNPGYRFVQDLESFNEGVWHANLKSEYVSLTTISKQPNRNLPPGYQADVNRIVKLLIGKSLYSDPFMFVRELVQNSVDACNRQKVIKSELRPGIVVNINSLDHYFEILDEGDGMTKKVLTEHFAVIGKSISQEFNDANGNFNLISQFGIGFISVFMAAQSVWIVTKNENDETISFQINDVFRGFDYGPFDNNFEKRVLDSGTAIRVYLKKNLPIQFVVNSLHSNCRHVENLSVILDGVPQQYQDDWNVANGTFRFEQTNERYEVRLTIGNAGRQIFASNCGFLINTLPQHALPFHFPYIVGGEINFRARAIDFDLSRTNIISSDKSEAVKKEISVSLRYLFRLVIESVDIQMKNVIYPYLQHYLVNIGQFQDQFKSSYVDFYSKSELIDLCLKVGRYNFRGELRELSTIFSTLRAEGIKNVYLHLPTTIDEMELAVYDFLQTGGNFVVLETLTTASFREGGFQTAASIYFATICAFYGMAVVPTSTFAYQIMQTSQYKKENLPERLIEVMRQLEEEFGKEIRLIELKESGKLMVKSRDKVVVNVDHSAFRLILQKIGSVSDSEIKIFLSGLLQLPPKSWSSDLKTKSEKE